MAHTIAVGQCVVNKAGEEGVIKAFDGNYITIQYQTRTAMFKADAFVQGHIKFTDSQLQAQVDADIAQATTAKKEAEDKAVRQAPAKTAAPVQKPVSEGGIRNETTKLLIDPAPVSLSAVAKTDRALAQEIFEACEADTKNLFSRFVPRMMYPKFTSKSRSKYCVGFLTKYKDTYVFRVFSRNDVYKKRVSTGITVMESNTAEVFRVMEVNGTVYAFSKNIAVSMGHYNNTVGNAKWRASWMGGNVFLNEVICNCDCGYLNGYVEDPAIHTEAFLFVDLLFLALKNNKAEIVFKNKAFNSTYRIDDLGAYLEGYTARQIDFASKHNVLHALRFMKEYGVSDLELLRDLESAVRNRQGRSAYEILLWRMQELGYDQAELDLRLMNFIKNVDYFNGSMYYDYLQELNFIPRDEITVQVLFDKDYIARHDALHQARMARYVQGDLEEERKAEEDYIKAAKELSWIDREDNGYFIIVPKTVEEFRKEGNAQHNCVYGLEYYRLVIDKESVIVFLRQEKNTSYVTIEYDYKTFEVEQALGKYNQKIDPELYAYIARLGKQLYYERCTQQ